MKRLSLHTPSLSYALTPEPHLEDQGVQGSVNTLEEVAASSNKAEYVGEREEEGREEKTFICNTFDDQYVVGFFFFFFCITPSFSSVLSLCRANLLMFRSFTLKLRKWTKQLFRNTQNIFRGHEGTTPYTPIPK